VYEHMCVYNWHEIPFWLLWTLFFENMINAKIMKSWDYESMHVKYGKD